MSDTRFAANLRAELDRWNTSQGELAGRLGVTQTAVSYWCCGRREPSLSMVCVIAGMFGVSTDQLLGRVVEAVDEVERMRQIAVEQKRLADEMTTLYGPIQLLARRGVLSAARETR